MLYRSAVFTFSSICSIRKVYVTPMPDTSSLKSIIFENPFCTGPYTYQPLLGIFVFCVCIFQQDPPKSSFNLTYCRNFYISKIIFLAKIISIQKCGFLGQGLQKKKNETKSRAAARFYLRMDE